MHHISECIACITSANVSLASHLHPLQFWLKLSLPTMATSSTEAYLQALVEMEELLGVGGAAAKAATAAPAPTAEAAAATPTLSSQTPMTPDSEQSDSDVEVVGTTPKAATPAPPKNPPIGAKKVKAATPAPPMASPPPLKKAKATAVADDRSLIIGQRPRPQLPPKEKWTVPKPAVPPFKSAPPKPKPSQAPEVQQMMAPLPPPPPPQLAPPPPPPLPGAFWSLLQPSPPSPPDLPVPPPPQLLPQPPPPPPKAKRVQDPNRPRGGKLSLWWSARVIARRENRLEQFERFNPAPKTMTEGRLWQETTI